MASELDGRLIGVMKRSVVAAVALVVLAIGLLVPPGAGRLARADVIHLSTGGKVEGTIVGEDEETVQIRTASGVVQTIYREDIERLERFASPAEELAKRKQALEAEAKARKASSAALAQRFFELAIWAEEQKLGPAEATPLLERAVALDPGHAGARERLGFVKVGSEWLTADEAARRKGLVRYEGKWVTPEDKEKLEQGLILVEGEWVPKPDPTIPPPTPKPMRPRPRKPAPGGTEDGGVPIVPVATDPEAEPQVGRPVPPPSGGFEPPPPEVIAALLAQQKAEAREAESVLGVKFEDVEEGPLLVHTTHARDSEILRETLRNLGKLYETESKIYALKMDDPIWPGKLQIYFFQAKAEFDRFATDVDGAPGAVQSGGYFIWGFGGGYSKLHIAMYNLDLGTLAHEMSHAFMSRYRYSERPVIPWINEGTAEYMRYLVVLGLKGQEGRHKGVVKLMLDRGDERVGLRTMMEKPEIAGTEGWAYAISWSLIDFMVKVDKAKFVKFLTALKLGEDGRYVEMSVDEQVRALEAAYGMTADKFEQGWKDHVRAYK